MSVFFWINPKSFFVLLTPNFTRPPLARQLTHQTQIYAKECNCLFALCVSSVHLQHSLSFCSCGTKSVCLLFLFTPRLGIFSLLSSLFCLLIHHCYDIPFMFLAFNTNGQFQASFYFLSSYLQNVYTK